MKNTLISLLILSTLSLLAIASTSCSENDAKLFQENSNEQKIADLIKAYSDEGKFSGAALVTAGGRTIFKGGYRMANYESNTPNQTDTKFSIGNMTQQFTALLILQLVAENKLDLNTPISSYLPDYPKDKADLITIHHLLTHSSGVPDYTQFPKCNKIQMETISPKELVNTFSSLPLEFTPGQKHSYSHSGYVLLGLILETSTGKTMEKVLTQKILTPLGMENTGVENSTIPLRNKADSYLKNWGGYYDFAYENWSEFILEETESQAEQFAAGSMYSTVEDLQRWNNALSTEKLLPKKYLDMMFTKHITAGGRYYGYGCYLEQMFVGKENKAIPFFSNYGFMDGSKTHFISIPSTNSMIILLSNTESSQLQKISYGIDRILFEQPYSFPNKSIARSMMEVINERGMLEGLTHFQEVKEDPNYYLDPDEFIFAGAKLVQMDKADFAVSILEVARKEFPNSFKIYDCYAAALLLIENEGRAIENYRTSVELNPGNQNAIDILNELGEDVESLLFQVSNEELALLKGTYRPMNEPSCGGEEWSLNIAIVDGNLVLIEDGKRYELTVIEENVFINQKGKFSLVFDKESYKNGIILTYWNSKFNAMRNVVFLKS